MDNDELRGRFNQVLSKQIEEWSAEGLSDDEIRTKLDNINYEDVFKAFIEKDAEDTVRYFKEHMYEIGFEEKINTNEFLVHQESIWGKGFVASQAMYVMTIEAAELYGKYVQEDVDDEVKEQKKYRFLVLQHMHGRACQIFLEILFLMRCGFADGAYARWRSMYELCCCACFILDQGEKIAEQYFLQSQNPNKSGNKSYSWANGAISNKGKSQEKWHFSEIQDYCGYNTKWKDIWDKQYKLACLVTHASPEGTFKRLSILNTNNALPVGHSDYGISTAAEHSAISLQWITSMFFSIFPYMDGLSRSRAISDWVKVIRDYYYSAEDGFHKNQEEET